MNLAVRLRDSGSQVIDGPAETTGDPSGDHLFDELYLEVVDRLDTRGVARLDPGELRARVGQLVAEAIEARQFTVSQRQRQQLTEAITDEILGLGPLQPLLLDPTINDILVNGCERVYVEREGVLHRTPIRFRDDAHLINTINRIVARVGRRIDEGSPMVDARLPDGSRVNAVIPPLAVDGPSLSIRRFRRDVASLERLVRKGSLDAEIARYLRQAVHARSNILVSGGTGAGKTTLLNALSAHISPHERIITIEDAAELSLQQEHIVRLESRPANIEGRGRVQIRDLVCNALRMRPDRIIVGEVRADEVLDMVQAMNTGHDGSMTTVHANGVEDAFTRLVSMLSLAAPQLSESMMLRMAARAVDLVVHLARLKSGRRVIREVAEVQGVVGTEVQLNVVYAYCGGHQGWSRGQTRRRARRELLDDDAPRRASPRPEVVR